MSASVVSCFGRGRIVFTLDTTGEHIFVEKLGTKVLDMNPHPKSKERLSEVDLGGHMGRQSTADLKRGGRNPFCCDLRPSGRHSDVTASPRPRDRRRMGEVVS